MLYRHAVGSQRGIPARIVAVGIVAVERLHLGTLVRTVVAQSLQQLRGVVREREGKQQLVRAVIVARAAVIENARRIHRHECGLLAEHRNAPAAGHGENAALGLKGGDGLEIAGGDLPGHIRQRMVKVTGKQDVGKSTHAVPP